MTLHRHPALCTHPEQQYLDLLRELLRAPPHATRNDTATRSLFGRQIRFDMAKGFPLLTTKKLPFRIIAAEVIWFLSGSTSVQPLQDQGIRIWDEWADKDTGELGPVYGKQWRSWTVGVDWNWGTEDTIDQIANVLDSLRRDPHGRRHIVTAWNPADVPEMALPPCHCFFQFNVGADGRLNLQLYQRSADIFLGVPFNIASYALLLHMFAAVLKRQPGEFVHTFGDVHLYSNHIEQAEQQVLRDPRPFPELRWGSPARRHDMDSWEISDFDLAGYAPWPHIAAPVSA